MTELRERVIEAARAYHDAYKAECVVHASDREDWAEAAARAHGARQDAEDALFAALDALDGEVGDGHR